MKRAQGSGVAMVWKCRAIVAFSSQKGEVAEGWVSVLTPLPALKRLYRMYGKKGGKERELRARGSGR